MTLADFRKSCIYFSVFCLAMSVPVCSLAANGQVNNTGPVTVTSTVYQTGGNSSSEQHNATEPATTTYSTSAYETQKKTEPKTTTTTNTPAAVSSKSHVIEKEAKININDHVVMVSGNMSLGYLNGKSKELVYSDAGNKISELDWRLSDVWMMGLGASIKPLSWLRFNGNVWFKLNDGSGAMDDYDWLLADYGYNEWTNWSHSTDTTLTKGMIYDINTEITFVRFNESSIYAILGYKHDNWKWVARGGTYDYWYWGESGSFPDEKVITYEQTFKTPYLGLGVHANLDPLTLTGRIIFSNWVKADDKDTHHLRNIYFTDDFSSGEMISVDLACTYNLTDHLAATAAFQYTSFQRTTGNAHALDLTTGETSSWPDGAGISNETTMVSLGMMYTL